MQCYNGLNNQKIWEKAKVELRTKLLSRVILSNSKNYASKITIGDQKKWALGKPVLQTLCHSGIPWAPAFFQLKPQDNIAKLIGSFLMNPKKCNF